MDRILTIENAQIIPKLHPKSRIVLVGGCFDLIHTGHIHFLKEAKKAGDILVVLLESDSSVRSKKGANRPVNTQPDRAYLLSELRCVDYVMLLPETTNNETYMDVTHSLKPAIIATTAGDPNLNQKQRVAQGAEAKVIEVVAVIKNKSTSHLADLLEKEGL